MNSKEIHPVDVTVNNSTLTQELHELVDKKNETSVDRRGIQENEISAEFDRLTSEIYGNFNELVNSNDYYYDLISKFRRSVEGMTSNVMYQVDSGDQLDRLAIEFSEKISSMLISEDSRGETGNIGINKQLRHEAEGLSSFNNDGSGLFEVAKGQIINYIHGYEEIADGQLNKEQLKITLKAIEYKLDDIYRTAHTIHTQIDNLLDFAERKLHDELSHFRGISYNSSRDNNWENKQGAAQALLNSYQNIMRDFETIRTESRKFAMSCQERLASLHNRAKVLDISIEVE